MLDALEERRELVGVAKSVGADRLEDVGQGWVKGDAGAVYVRVPQVFDVLGEVAEEEDVVFANLAVRSVLVHRDA